jgi:hypothetical protein
MRGGKEKVCVCVLEIVRPGMERFRICKKNRKIQGSDQPAHRNRAMSTEVVASSSCAGLTRASIFIARSLYEERWIAGSSPAMTARVSSPRKRGPITTVFGYGSRLSLRSAGTTIFHTNEEPTCGCGKRSRAAIHCFRIVIYNDLRNSNVSGRQQAQACARR